MRKLKVYLETSVFNFMFADDAPDKREDTLALFEEIRQAKFAAYTSAYALEELELAPEPKRENMYSLIAEYGISVLPAGGEAEALAHMYVAEGIIPSKHSADARHIAVATVHDLDVVASYNFKHIVKWKTVSMTEVINLREGYRRIGIFSPTEIITNG